MTGWLVVADDLTGACDTGAAFAQSGWRTHVLLRVDKGSAAHEEGDVLVVTTESRPLDQSAAENAIRDVMGLLCGSQTLNAPGRTESRRIYKKIDSTLRGHPAAELEAVMQAACIDRALVCPAFPAQGRVVREGNLFVHGVAFEETGFAGPGATGSLVELFDLGLGSILLPLSIVREGVQELLVWIRNHPSQVIVADAENEADLRALASAGLEAGLRLFCGSAGLARALAPEQPGLGGETLAGKGGGPVLVVVGTQHPCRQAQISRLLQSGAAALAPEPAVLGDPEQWPVLACHVQEGLQRGQAVVLHCETLRYQSGEEQHVAQFLAEVSAMALRDSSAACLVLTGGDTAWAVCQVLDCRSITLGGEVLPGMAWGRMEGGLAEGRVVVTKAGGFGSPDTLLEAVRFLQAL